MHDFAAHVLRRYYEQTEWNPFNSYLYLTQSSQAVLDFAIPHGLSLSISASPSPPFFSTYRLRALPNLTGALGYVFASIEDNDGQSQVLDLGGGSRTIRFKHLVERFRIHEAPRRPLGKDEVWQGGKRVNKRDYLMYGCLHIPSARVDALVATRLAPTWQLIATAISTPPRNPLGLSPSNHYYHPTNPSTASGEASSGAAAQQPVASAGPPPGSTNLHINLQHDTGKWFTEYSYSVDDGLLGFRVLHNLGNIQSESTSAAPLSSQLTEGNDDVTLEELNRRQKVEEENNIEGLAGGGLQGRFSVGAELFFSPLEKSAGLSTGMRFTTLPEPKTSLSAIPTQSSMSDAANAIAESMENAPPSQPPTTITATLNPMMGHLSTAYAARMTRDIVACSRFDFNVYSYESELTLGAEYWLRAKNDVRQAWDAVEKASNTEDETAADTTLFSSPTERLLSAKEQPSLSLRDSSTDLTNKSSSALQKLEQSKPERGWSLRDKIDDGDSLQAISSQVSTSTAPVDGTDAQSSPSPSHTLGVLKTRISTSGLAALLWEGRLRNCLVSFGIRGDLLSIDAMSAKAGGANAAPFLRGVGIDVIYFSQDGQ